LSWSEIVTQAVITRVHRGVADPDQALLGYSPKFFLLAVELFLRKRIAGLQIFELNKLFKQI